LILGQIKSVLPGTTDPGARKKMKNAVQNASRLNELVNQLLDLSRLEFGQMNLTFIRQNAVPLINKIGNSFETLAEDRNISLEVITPDKQIILDHDPDKLEKILTNLVSNAIKFTGEGGTVCVETCLAPLPELNDSDQTANKHLSTNPETEKPDGVLFQVSDNGIGIPEKHLPHIFDRFFQVDDSDTRLFEGSGIGLALTKQLVELHKGLIWVDSTENEGSTFFVWLPLNQSEQLILQTETPAVADPDSSSFITEQTPQHFESIDEKKAYTETVNGSEENRDLVLIVEDNADMQDYLQSYLGQWYSVITASNGESGYKKAVSIIPDLIVCDVMMPKMNGLEFMQHLRKDEKTSHIPVIMLTARADDEHKLSGIESGVDAYLTKPFNDKELKLRIDKLIAMRKSLRKQFADQLFIRPEEVQATSLDQKFLGRVIDAIESNIDNEMYSVEALAADVNMSQAQLNRKVNALINQPPGKLIRSMRLQRAADLLEKGAGNVAEICYQTGFSSQATFSRSFKKQFGTTPSKYSQKFQ
ncbi:MAG: ATP-binding protein, partial [Balneolaceae bacterium]|nr:ATP-binding protein [Balneolaceae bacterium]